MMMVLLPSVNGRRLQLCLCFAPQIDVLKCPSNMQQETSVSECREKFVGVIFLSFSLHSFCSMKKKKKKTIVATKSEDGDWLFEASFFRSIMYLFLKEEETWRETFFSRGLNGGQASQRHHDEC